MKLGSFILSLLSTSDFKDKLPEEFTPFISALDNLEIVRGSMEATIRIFGAEVTYSVSTDMENFDDKAFTDAVATVTNLAEEMKNSSLTPDSSVEEQLANLRAELSRKHEVELD